MLKTIIMLPDGTEVSSGSNTLNAVQSVTLTECVNSGEELTIGSACANALEAKTLTPAGGLSVAAGAEVVLYKENESGTRVKLGVFTLEKPTRPSANTMKLTGYDHVAKLDRDLTEWLNSLTEWPYALNTFADMVCAACGLTFRTTDVPNSDFQVQQFVRSSVTGRQLMRWLGEICCRFCRANADGEIEFAWYEDSGKTVTASGDLYYFQNGLTYENYQTAAIDAVQIRLADSENGALWPAAEDGANSYIITGNPILNSRVTEDLEPVLANIKAELAGVSYTPCKVSIPANLDIHAGNTVRITDKNGKTITTYVMTKTQTGQKDTLECTGSRRRDSTVAVNSQSQSSAAAAAAQNAFAGITWEQMFKKWTDNGRIQGVFAEDGVWVINASAAVIRNIVADSIETGILKSKDGGVYIDLDNGVGNLVRGVSVTLTTWDDDMAGFTKDIDTVIDGFLVEQIQNMRENTIRDFALKLFSAQKYPEAAKLTVFTYRKYSGVLAASISFEWTDGSRSLKTATDESAGWTVTAMEWL